MQAIIFIVAIIAICAVVIILVNRPIISHVALPEKVLVSLAASGGIYPKAAGPVNKDMALGLIRECNVDYPWKPFYSDDLFLTRGYGFVQDSVKALKEMKAAGQTDKLIFLQKIGKTEINSDLFSELISFNEPILERNVILAIMLRYSCLFRDDKNANAILLYSKSVPNLYS